MPASWVAAAVAVVGSLEASKSASNASKTNAAMDSVQAQEELSRAAINVRQQTVTNAYQEGAQKAAYAGSGVVLSTGSPMDEMANKVMQDKYETQVQEYNGLINANASTADAAYQNSLASTESLSGYINAASIGSNFLLSKYGVSSSTHSAELSNVQSTIAAGGSSYDVNAAATIPGA